MTKIMLVEDDKSLREIYGVRLLAEGYQIISAGDGEEALAMAVKEKPDLIISDVMMPKISGFDMLDILRSTPETKDLKVIMMTALSSEDQRERGEALGANKYLVKSQIGIEDVVRTVHEVLSDVPVKASAPTNQFQGTTDATPIAQTQQPASQTAMPAQAPVQPAESAQQPIAMPQPQLQMTVPAPTAVESTTQSTPVNIPVQSETPPVSPEPITPATPPAQDLPQPTAPFSTDAPASLASDMMNQSNQPAPAVEQPQANIEPEPQIQPDNQAPTEYSSEPAQASAPAQPNDISSLINQELQKES